MTTNVVVRNAFLSTDIICVRFFGSFVLAGVGGTLKIFSLKSKTCVKELEVFRGHKIYEIQPDASNNVIIFGGKSVKIYLFSNIQDDVTFTYVASLCLKDWILAAHWLSKGEKIVFVTAHNNAWLWEWPDNNSSLEQASCSEKCILYSATVCGDDWTNCVVFAGTVFREVVIWLPGGNLGGDQPVLHRLQGHNGVIFSMSWDWHSSSLCSTSDDRSIRLWSISIPNKHDWKSSHVICSQVFFGHSARVWKSVIFQDYIVSVGEDCQICIWSVKGKLLQTLERTLSGCQWSLDYSKDHQLLVAGAGDGSIQLLPLMLPLSSPVSIPISYPETLLELLSASRVRKLVILRTGCIVVVTEDGTVLSGYPSASDSWKIVSKDDRFRNYCILSISPDRTRFSLASLKGLVVIFDGDSPDTIAWTLEQQVEDGKIWSLLWLSNKEILVCGDEGCMSVWQICQTPELKLFCNKRLRLPRARERWPTCAKLWMKDHQVFLLCGDRCGSVHLFNVQTSLDEEPSAPDHSLYKLHGKLGVTSLSEWGGHIFSTGRDGSVRILFIDQTSKQLSVLFTDKMIMDWVCTVLPIVSRLKHFLIIGFKETKIIVWSTQERRTILNFDCGGGHRSWDCIISGDRILEIAYIREKHILFSSWNLDTLMKPTLLFGISPRELNCAVKVLTLPSCLLFGGEDGTIYLCKFSGNYLSFETKLTLTSHISSVRCICLHGDLFFSAGGRAQLKAWQIKKENKDEYLCMELASLMLKGEQHSRSGPSIDPEMRFMSLCCIPSPSSQHLIQLVSGCSDGALRWLTFNSTNRKFQIVGESMFHHKCVLKLFSASLSQDQVVLISTATDGTIALWNTDSDMFTQPDVMRQPYWSNRVHQSGVNSVHIKEFSAVEGSLILLASGGDDNSVVLSALNVRNKNVTIVDKWSSSSAHAAQVTGVWLVGDWLLSTSIDQRLTVWTVTFSSDPYQLKCDFLHQSIFSVPDIQDMQVWLEKNLLNICVVGKGVQIISIPF